MKAAQPPRQFKLPNHHGSRTFESLDASSEHELIDEAEQARIVDNNENLSDESTVVSLTPPRRRPQLSLRKQVIKRATNSTLAASKGSAPVEERAAVFDDNKRFSVRSFVSTSDETENRVTKNRNETKFNGQPTQPYQQAKRRRAPSDGQPA